MARYVPWSITRGTVGVGPATGYSTRGDALFGSRGTKIKMGGRSFMLEPAEAKHPGSGLLVVPDLPAVTLSSGDFEHLRRDPLIRPIGLKYMLRCPICERLAERSTTAHYVMAFQSIL